MKILNYFLKLFQVKMYQFEYYQPYLTIPSIDSKFQDSSKTNRSKHLS